MVKNSHKYVTLYLSLVEKDVIEKYTNTPLPLIMKLKASIEQAQLRRKDVKKVLVTFTLKELDALITHIADKANQEDSLPKVQYILDRLFGRLATKYNENLS